MPLDFNLAPYIRQNIQTALDEDIGTLSPALSRRPPPLLNPLPQAGEETNEKGNLQSLRERGTENRYAVISNGDLTAQLIPADVPGHASVITRLPVVLCGTPWFEACYLALDPGCKIRWHVKEGEVAAANQTLCEINGNARAMLSAERCSLNFLQTLSATATLTRRYVEAVAGTGAKIMDTRKTLPGLRIAQKYAVKVGGGHNQRIGLFDGVLIKENHIAAAGGISEVMELALRITPPGVPIQIEVESLAQLDQALNAGARLILLDNFSLTDMRLAVSHAAKRAELEASGGITMENVRSVAETGVGRISIGALTKDVLAADLSMRFA